MRSMTQMLEDVREKRVAREERMAIEDEQKQAGIRRDAEIYVANVLHSKLADVEKRIEAAMTSDQTQLLVNVAPNGPRGRALLVALARELETLGFRCYKQPVNDWHTNDKVSFTLAVHWPSSTQKELEFRGN